MKTDQGIPAYPLEWPPTVPRSKSRARADFGAMKAHESGDGKSRARLSIEQARTRVSDELRRLGAVRPIISTNLLLRVTDGLPRSGQTQPKDPGVAVYFTRRGEAGQEVIAIDRWDRVEDNLAAVAKTIDALRGLERWGGGRIVAAAFSGFKALPGPLITPSDESFPTVDAAAAWIAGQCVGDSFVEGPFAVTTVRSVYEQAARKLAKRFHPDVAGETAAGDWRRLQAAKALLDAHHKL